MEIDDSQLFDFMQDTSNKLGKVLQGQENMAEHLSAVSHKADAIRESLNIHKDSTDAHGMISERRNSAATAIWVAIIISVLGAAVNIFKAFAK